MAISPIAQYPEGVASDAAYPYGKARNVSSPGAGDGTPWEQALINDLFGLSQAILVAAGIEPSGTPDSATDSQYLEALRLLINTMSKESGHVGEVLTLAADSAEAAPAGFLFLDGSELNRETYSELWAWAQANARVVSDFSWNSGTENRPSFSSGDGSTTFRVPDVRGLFPRWWGGNGVWDASRTAMLLQRDALQNITGSFGPVTIRGTDFATGAFSITSQGQGLGFDQSTDDEYFDVHFSANDSPNARTATETRPINVAFPAFIRYRSTVA